MFTSVHFTQDTSFFQRFIMQSYKHIDGTRGCLSKKPVGSQYIFESKKFDIGPQCHFPKAIGVKVKLILSYFSEVLMY